MGWTPLCGIFWTERPRKKRTFTGYTIHGSWAGTFFSILWNAFNCLWSTAISLLLCMWGLKLMGIVCWISVKNSRSVSVISGKVFQCWKCLFVKLPSHRRNCVYLKLWIYTSIYEYIQSLLWKFIENPFLFKFLPLESTLVQGKATGHYLHTFSNTNTQIKPLDYSKM